MEHCFVALEAVNGSKVSNKNRTNRSADVLFMDTSPLKLRRSSAEVSINP